MSDNGYVLVIDDDAERGQALADRLSGTGFRANVVTNPEAALECLLGEDEVDVMLCELDLDADAWRPTRHALRERDLQIPTVIVSDHAEVERMMTALRLGASDFFERPVEDLEALTKSLERSVRQRRLRRELKESRERLEKANTELRGTVHMLEQDQQAGRQVQLRMLPSSPLEVGPYTFSHRVIPSLFLSGDFTDYFTVGDHHVVFFMADVSGHGSSSAFTTVLLKNLFARKRSDFFRRADATILDPVDMLQRVNKELLGLSTGKFATIVVGALDTTANRLRYSVAGHLPLPVLVSEGRARYLEGEGNAVGMLEEAEFTETCLDLPPGFQLVLFSDGILEILPPGDLIEREKSLLGLVEETAGVPEALESRLQLDRLDAAPDDIAALYISRRN